jgi:hypothetical protein|tara:strand:+ start:3964 stop:4314 length:351 start_codon:yes stop_codon:yes gene_type:complete
MSKKTAKVEAQLNRVDALTILRNKCGTDAEALRALDVFTRVNSSSKAKRYGLKETMVLSRGSKSPRMTYMLERVELADGMTVADAMKKVPNGHHPSYRFVDIEYDINHGYLQDPRS